MTVMDDLQVPNETHETESQKPNHSKDAERNEYDPYVHGNNKDPISAAGAVIHIIRMTIGVGILALPLIHKRVGYLVGTCESLIVGLLYYHIIHLLVATEYKLCKLTKTSKLTFMNVVNTTFQVVSPRKQILGPFVKIVMHIYYGIPFGNALGLIVLSTNIKRILEYYNIEVKTTMILSVIIFPIILLCYVRKLKFMVPLSALTNIFTCVIICTVFVNSVTSRKPGTVAQPIGDITFIPQSFAMLIAAYRCTGIYIPLKNEMKNPRQFSSHAGVINTAGTVLITLYTTFGATIYWNYGEDVQDNILMSLPKNEWLPVAICALYTSALIVQYYLSFYVRIDMYWTSFLEPMTANSWYQVVFEYFFRTALNICIYIMAICIPNFALVSSISGTIGILAEIGVPPLLEILLIDMSDWKSSWFLKITKNLCLVIFSLILFITSIAGCVREIIKIYSE